MSPFRSAHPVRRRLAACALVLTVSTLPFALTGCSLLQQVIEKQTGGKVDLAGKKIPDDFPTSQVPLIDADIQYGASVKQPGTGEVWNLTFTSTNASAFDAISSQLTGAGFQGPINRSDDSDSSTASFEKVPYDLIVVVEKDSDGKYTINYTVTDAEYSPSPTPTP